MDSPKIVHHGAGEGVTGSCHQFWMDKDNSVLIDCGQFQGEEFESAGEGLALDFPISGIKALIITHVHIDHVGRIPNLLAAGFDGPILCSEPSARLLPIVLEDAFQLSVSRDEHELERYLALVESRLIALPYGRWFTLHESDQITCQLRLQPAGHVLGSAYVELDLGEAGRSPRRIVFSGDLGASHSPILPDLVPPERADLLILESTYGDRLHEDVSIGGNVFRLPWNERWRMRAPCLYRPSALAVHKTCCTNSKRSSTNRPSVPQGPLRTHQGNLRNRRWM